MNRKYRFALLSLAIAINIHSPIAFAQTQDYQDLDSNGFLGVFKISKSNTKYYEVPDDNRPRLGSILLQIDFNTGPSGGKVTHNFRFCDGSTAQVEIEKLRPSSRSCNDPPPKNPLDNRDSPFTDATLFNLESEKLGTIVSIAQSTSGDIIGIARMYGNPAQDFKMKPVDLSSTNAVERALSDLSLEQNDKKALLNLKEQGLLQFQGREVPLFEVGSWELVPLIDQTDASNTGYAIKQSEDD